MENEILSEQENNILKEKSNDKVVFVINHPLGIFSIVSLGLIAPPNFLF